MAKKNVGFIGLGIMGQAMAGHILASGCDLHVFNRSKAKADGLVAQGAVWQNSPGKIASVCDVVVTTVGYPSDVEAIYLGKDGIIENAREGSVLIDMTTSSPELAGIIAERATAGGMKALDAPVSGGDIGARNAKLSIMVGGSEEAFNGALPLFRVMGSKIAHMGPAGAGQHTKMANQIAIASTMLGVCESLSYAKAAGLDLRKLLDVIGGGAASSFALNVLGQRIVDGDYSPGFFIHHFVKDMSIAIAEAERMKLDLPGLALAKKLYQRLVDSGFANDGTQALFRGYDPNTTKKADEG